MQQGVIIQVEFDLASEIVILISKKIIIIFFIKLQGHCADNLNINLNADSSQTVRKQRLCFKPLAAF